MPSLKTRYAANTLDDLTCYLTILRLSNPQHPQCNHTDISYKKKFGVEVLRRTRSSKECYKGFYSGKSQVMG